MGRIDRILEEVFTRRAALSTNQKKGPCTRPKAGCRYLPKPKPPPPKLPSPEKDMYQQMDMRKDNQAQTAYPDEEAEEQWEQWEEEQETYPADGEAEEEEAFPIDEDVEEQEEEWYQEGEEDVDPAVEPEEDWCQREDPDKGEEEWEAPVSAPRLTPSKGQKYGPHPTYIPLNAGWKGKGKGWGMKGHQTPLVCPQVTRNLVHPIDYPDHPLRCYRQRERMVRPAFQVRSPPMPMWIHPIYDPNHPAHQANRGTQGWQPPPYPMSMNEGNMATRAQMERKAPAGTPAKHRRALKAAPEEEDDWEEAGCESEESDISMANIPGEPTRAPKRQQPPGDSQNTQPKKRKIWVKIKGKRYEARYWKK